MPRSSVIITEKEGMLLEETEGVAPAASNRMRTFPAERHKKRQKDR